MKKPKGYSTVLVIHPNQDYAFYEDFFSQKIRVQKESES